MVMEAKASLIQNLQGGEPEAAGAIQSGVQSQEELWLVV